MQKSELLMYKVSQCVSYAETHNLPKSDMEWASAVTDVAMTIPDVLGTGKFQTKTEGEGDDARVVKKEIIVKHDKAK